MNFQSWATRRRTSRFFIYALGFTASIGGFAGYAGTAQKNEGDVHSEVAIMQALLLEVRQLRQEVGHIAAVNGRVQITLQQMQLQEERLNHASLRLEDVHKRIDTLLSQQANTASTLQNIEARLGQEHDPGRLPQLQEEQAQLKAMMERFPAMEAQLRAQEADAATQVQSEQNKWQELSDQLSALTQSLGADSTGATSKERKDP